MKPTSIISLIVAVLLVVVGLVTCMVAQNMATANGEYLFAETRGDDLVQTVDLTDSEISKIELIVSNAVINITGKSEKSYVEFVNFKENYYSVSQTNRVLSFDEIPDVVSMLKFWENGFSFKGMRYILNTDLFKKDKDDGTRQKVINVYLSRNLDIKIFDLQVNSCTLNIQDLTSSSDYNISAEQLEINTDTLKTTSAFNVTGPDGTKAKSVQLNMHTTFLTNFTVLADELQLDTDLFRCTGIGNLECQAGSLKIGTIRKPSDMNLNFSTESGIIQIDGEEIGKTYTYTGNDTSDSMLTIQTESAAIDLFTQNTSTSSEDASNS